MIEVNGITKRYGTRTAVEDLSFTMEKGKVYGFLGPNGAGKSTTMNIVTGYIAPTSGTVMVCGYDMAKDPEQAKRHIGYLPEIPPLYPDMTVSEYLQYVSALKQVPKKKRRDELARIMKMTQIGTYGNRLIRNLSKGYKQRVGMAQALVGFPEVIILDEPTVGLDPQQVKDVREMIASLRDDHIIVLSSHILAEVSAVCDELLIISRGKKVAQGSRKDLEASFGTQDLLQVTVKDDGRDDLEGRVREALTGAGFTVTQIHPGGKSLEELFLSMTEDTLADNDAGEEKTP